MVVFTSLYIDHILLILMFWRALLILIKGDASCTCVCNDIRVTLVCYLGSLMGLNTGSLIVISTTAADVIRRLRVVPSCCYRFTMAIY
jgi:hypothetical protein